MKSGSSTTLFSAVDLYIPAQYHSGSSNSDEIEAIGLVYELSIFFVTVRVTYGKIVSMYMNPQD